MIHPVVFNTSEILHHIGVRHVVLSPGSRNAPLTISFARNEKIKKWIIPDERSAAFIALGIAQREKEPVVLVCTSGTAVLNYAPAVAEAFYREIPLIVISADRPLELVDQRDGQTIRQFGVLKNHVKNSYQLPIATNQSAQEYLNKVVESGLYAQELPLGPVHLNIPFKEPFYPADNQELKFSNIKINLPGKSVHKEHLSSWTGYQKILILIGQKNPSIKDDETLSDLAKKVPVITSPLSNVQIESDIRNSDLFLNDQPELKPDLLITYGLSVLSKKVKNYIRKNKPVAHWHLDPAGVKVDTYGTNPKLIRAKIEELIYDLKEADIDEEYLVKWQSWDATSRESRESLVLSQDFSELTATSLLLQNLPSDSILHLGNSMPVRFAEILGVKKESEVYCNRGTSGIDGVTSTAVGTALANPDKQNILITGDLSFLYDRNAFFHQYKVPNLKVIVMNNQGGGIFRLIDGPSQQPELEDYFETRHRFTAEFCAKEYGLKYLIAKDERDLKDAVENLFEESDHCTLLEVFTQPATNEKVYRTFRRAFS